MNAGPITAARSPGPASNTPTPSAVLAPTFSTFSAPLQALALTDVVVEAAVTALLLAFAIQAHKRFGTLDPHELVQLKG